MDKIDLVLIGTLKDNCLVVLSGLGARLGISRAKFSVGFSGLENPSSLQ